MVNAKVTEDGHIKCPKCGVIIITPIAYNPHKNQQEKMILYAGQPGQCKLCGLGFTVTEEEALKHNRFWYPDDPEFKK